MLLVTADYQPMKRTGLMLLMIHLINKNPPNIDTINPICGGIMLINFVK